MSLTRYRLDVVLVTTSSIHSGGPEEEVDRRSKAIGNDDRKAVPQQFARNASGTPVLTGRSVKGALRAAFFEALDRKLVTCPEILNPQRLKDLWGKGPEDKEQDNEEARGEDDAPSGWASALTFETVSLECVKKADEPDKKEDSFVRRPGIAIDRYWGSAGDGALFFHEVAPEGQKLHLGITAEVDPCRFAKEDRPMIEELEADVEQLFAVILGLLDSGRFAFGKRKGAGWGRVKIDEEIRDGEPKLRCSLTKARLDDVEGLKAWLKGKPASGTDCLKPATLRTGNQITIKIHWESPTGILVAETDEEDQAGKEGNNEDSAAKTNKGSENQKGSEANRKSSDAVPQKARSSEESPHTQKGATKPSAADKSQKGEKPREGDKSSKTGEAENADGQKDPRNVARPLRAYKTADGKPKAPLVLPGSSVRGALRARASRIARTILYRKREDKTPDWSNVPVHDQLANDPTLVRALFGTTERRGAVTVLDTLSIPSEAGEAEKLRTVTHNAGDRWTGGVIDGGLYEEKYPIPDWEPLHIEVDLDRIVDPLQDEGRSKNNAKPKDDGGLKGDRGPKANTGLNTDAESQIKGEPQANSNPQTDSRSQGTPSANDRHDQIDLDRRRAAICLLGLTLAELATGTLPLGSRGTRGMGQVKVTRLIVKGPEGLKGSEEILPPQGWDIPENDGESMGEKTPRSQKPGIQEDDGTCVASQLLAKLQGVNKKIKKNTADSLHDNWTDFLHEEIVEGQPTSPDTSTFVDDVHASAVKASTQVKDKKA